MPTHFDSSVPFTAERIQAAAVYCSDGRFGEQFDEFMHQGLGLPRYDRLAVPGGSACLASHFVTYRESEAIIEQLRFLVQVHGLQHVVLIAHEGCAYYAQRLRVSPLQLESQQRDDMRKAIARVRSLGPHMTIQSVFARKLADGLIRFELLEV